MKSTTIKELIENYIPPEPTTIGIYNPNMSNISIEAKKKKSKINKIKDIKNPSIKSRRKPRYFNINKNNIKKKKIKSISRKKILENNRNNKYNNLINEINNINTKRANINKSICTDSNGNYVATNHERNLSAPSLICEKNNNYKNIYNKKKKGNIIKLNQRNKKIDENIINKDNYNDKIERLNYFNNNINNLTTNHDKSNSLIKVNLNKTTIEENEYINYINSYNKNNLTSNNFYKNFKNKKQNRNYLLDNEFDISNYNKNIENIKSIQENIILLKEQLKDDKKMDDKKLKTNYKNKYKENNTKINLNCTINTSNSTTINNSSNNNNNNIIHNKNKNSNRINYNIINNNNYTISNFHNYNKNILNKNNNGKNYSNKTNNTYFNNTSITSNDVTPNKTIINSTNRSHNLNNNNLSNSSNNKTISISTNITNNNGFGKKINLTSVYGGHNDKDNNENDEINFFKDKKESFNSVSNDKNKLGNNFNDNPIDNCSQLKKDKLKEEINIQMDMIKNTDNNNIKKENNFINNKITKDYNRNIIKDNSSKNDINIKKDIDNKNGNYLYKASNTLTLQNQFNSFKNPKINKKENDKSKNKEKKEINNYQNKNHKNYQKKLNTKNNNQNNIYMNNILNNINKNITNNSLNLRYNTINNDNFINFNSNHKPKNNIKSNVSHENTHKKTKDISKKKIQNSKNIETNNNCSQNIDNGIKKRNSCKPYMHKDKDKNKDINESNENIHSSVNKVKKFFSKYDFKYKSIYKIGVICKAGEVVFGETKTNQDNYFNYSLNEDMRFIGVCDGHGEYGHHVSKFLRNYLPIELEKDLKELYKEESNIINKEMSGCCNNNKNNNINQENNENSNNSKNNKTDNKNDILGKIRKVFEKSFSRTDQTLSELCRNLNTLNTDEENIFDVEYSGSTCVSILLKEKNINKIYIANVGDSRAIIIKQTKNKYWTCQQLSRDHKPIEKDEAQRILDYDGEIEKIEDDDGNWTGPLRVWVKESDGPGLAMTRSFGDEVGASVGVISKPEVGEYKIKEEDKAIIIASDGLWEYITNKEVTDIVKKLINKRDVNIIVNELYKESVNRWKIKDQGIDDITIICILLKNN